MGARPQATRFGSFSGRVLFVWSSLPCRPLWPLAPPFVCGTSCLQLVSGRARVELWLGRVCFLPLASMTLANTPPVPFRSVPPSPHPRSDDVRSKHNASEQRRAKKIKDGIDGLKALMEVGVSGRGNAMGTRHGWRIRDARKAWPWESVGLCSCCALVHGAAHSSPAHGAMKCCCCMGRGDCPRRVPSWQMRMIRALHG